MGFNTATNAAAAKLIGAATVILGIVLIGDWGLLSAVILIAAGGVLLAGAGDELPRVSLRNVGLFVFYWLFLLLGIGVGIE